jgi:hypothetical protein
MTVIPKQIVDIVGEAINKKLDAELLALVNPTAKEPDTEPEDPEGDDDESVSTLFTEYFESDCYDEDD